MTEFFGPQFDNYQDFFFSEGPLIPYLFTYFLIIGSYYKDSNKQIIVKIDNLQNLASLLYNLYIVILNTTIKMCFSTLYRTLWLNSVNYK